MTQSSPDIVERLRFIMPSSLNDALRTMEDAAQEIDRLRIQIGILTEPSVGAAQAPRATSPIGQSDVEALRNLAECMNGKTREMLLRVIAACPYLTVQPQGMEEENRRLRERLGPRGLEVVLIDGAGHYVNEKVKAEIDRLRAVPQTPPLGWLHQIEEPSGETSKLYSSSQDNPWDHWIEKYKSQCTYTATPLYAAPSAQSSEVTSEAIARTICLSYGRDPDAMTSIMEMCDADNKPVPTWTVYEEQADAILAAYSVSRPHHGGDASEATGN